MRQRDPGTGSDTWEPMVAWDVAEDETITEWGLVKSHPSCQAHLSSFVLPIIYVHVQANGLCYVIPQAQANDLCYTIPRVGLICTQCLYLCMGQCPLLCHPSCGTRLCLLVSMLMYGQWPLLCLCLYELDFFYFSFNT